MEKISNEEKAKKICENCMLKNKPFPKQLLEKELTHCDLCPSASIALKAMRWKDEQFAQERQQWIEKTCEWIKDNATYYAHWEWNGDTYEKEVVFDAECCAEAFIEAIKESMKGE